MADFTGIHARELRRMRWDHIALTTGILQIKRSKHGEKRAVAVTDEGLELVQN